MCLLHVKKGKHKNQNESSRLNVGVTNIPVLPMAFPVLWCVPGHTGVVASLLSSIRAYTLLYWEEILPNCSIFFPLSPSPSPRMEPQLHWRKPLVTFPHLPHTRRGFRAWNKNASMGSFCSTRWVNWTDYISLHRLEIQGIGHTGWKKESEWVHQDCFVWK